MIKGSTPQQDGYRMPADFEPHQECFMIWPERTDNWRQGAKPAQKAYTDVATAIKKFEPVTVLASQTQYENARNMLPNSIRVIEMSNNDAWIKDYGPSYVINSQGQIRGIDWRFNAWGGLLDGLYFPWDKDDQIARKLCELNHFDYYMLDSFVLEGCSILVDGEDTLITTEECLLSEGRNGTLTKEQIEHILKSYFSVTKIIWLNRGCFLDETNGHVDNIINFVRPGELVLSWTDNQLDPQYEISKECFDILSNETDARGRQFVIHKLHCPNPMTITTEESLGIDPVNGKMPRQAGDRMAASYVNYFTSNGGIIFPIFDDPHDDDARILLQKLYPTYEIIGIPAREILIGGGNIHCIAQSIPDIQRKKV